MKEKIVIKDTEQTFNIVAQFPTQVKPKDFEHTIEQVPETFEELKELVREKVYDDNRNGVKIGQCVKIEYILIDGKSFMLDGEILDEDNDVFAVNRTPQQMWQIIKNLIGEE